MRIGRLTRRDLLRISAAMPLLTCVFRGRARAEAPYLSLQRFIPPGNDDFKGEVAAAQLAAMLKTAIRTGRLPVAAGVTGRSPVAEYRQLAPDVRVAAYPPSTEDIAAGWRRWTQSLGPINDARVYVLPESRVRFEIAGPQEYRVGHWRVEFSGGSITRFEPLEEEIATGTPWFRDVTAHALSAAPEAREQLSRGIPYWRSRLDPASGIDTYGSNGIAVGDIDNDGLDEVYVCQPGGLPNRLLKFRDDGTVVDLTREWGVDMLDDTSCALFLDLRNSGRQDLVVLRASGPLLFLNEGTRFRMRTDAFSFATPPRGGFTGMAAADFDRDGKLDLYLCCYVYFQSEAQYTYAAPYHDARNGPPNFLFRNELNPDGSGAFRDVTERTGLNENNDRFSFAPAWCDTTGDGWPDLYVANDFGRKNFYRNREGKFRDEAEQAGVDDIGPGMSAAWFDYDGDGKPDLYVANMWTDAGQRAVADPAFAPAQAFPAAYRAHTMGNSLFQNQGDSSFRNVTEQQRVAFGRWAWCSGGHDFDNNGEPEILVTSGMLTNESESDLDGFFWRQVVAKSPTQAQPAPAYENGWNALNQFVREEYSWSGHQPNVFHVRRGGRYFDFSGISGLDFAQDSRAFAVVDFDDDGRPDVLLKSRLGPQLRVLQNQCAGTRPSLAICLRATKGNRDAIGARVEVNGQTKWLDAGSGFLAQNSKRLIFATSGPATVRIVWPSGAKQVFENLEPGSTYTLAEGSSETESRPFRTHRPLPDDAAPADNSLRLEDTTFLEPVPLPSKAPTAGLFTIREATPEWQIFRRYLFDWRAKLQPPLTLRLNDAGDAIGVVVDGKRSEPLPYRGFYVNQPGRDFFKFGAAYLWAGFPDKALPYLERVLAKTPDNARLLVLTGQIYLDQNRDAEAANSFEKAAQIDPKSVNAWIGLGDIAAKQNRLADAETNYARALALSPESPEAANGLGLAQAKAGKLADARRNLELAIRLKRDYAEAINNLAVLYAQQGKMDDALAAWQYGIQVAPDADILYLNLGRAYVGMGQRDRARVAMQELLDRKPDDETARRAIRELEESRP